MGSPEELLGPIKTVLSDLVGFAHERYCDAIKPSGAVVEQLRLVAAAEAFQTMSAVQQISQAVHNLERTLGDVDYWSKQQLDMGLSMSDALDEALEKPRALLAPTQEPLLQHGSWGCKGQYVMQLGSARIEVATAGADQVVAPRRAVVIDLDEGVVLDEGEWQELRAATDWLMAAPTPPPLSEEVEGKR